MKEAGAGNAGGMDRAGGDAGGTSPQGEAPTHPIERQLHKQFS